MSTTALITSPGLREQELGIGQSLRAWQATQASRRTRLVLDTMIKQRLINTIGQDTGIFSRPLALLVLHTTATEIVTALQAAVEHSVVVTIATGKKIPNANYQDLLQRKRASVKPLLPIYHYPSLPADLQNKWPLTTPVNGPSCLMDSAFQAMCTQVVDSVTNYACELMANGLLGFTRGSNSAYSYTLHTMELDPSAFTSEHTVETDPTARWGERITDTMWSKGSGAARHVTTEHTHYLGADTKTVPLKTTRVNLPQRVATLKRTLPEWTLPYLTVTTGTIIREEIDERDQYHTEWQSDVITTQWKRSPALALGEIVLAGWSDSDFESECRIRLAIIADGHAGLWILGGLAVAAVICILFPGVGAAVARVAAGATARATAATIA